MPKASHDRGLVVIAVFKLVKALLLILAGFGALSLLSEPVAAEVRDWLAEFSMRHGHRFIERALQMLNVASPRQMTLVGAASICYGLLFATEGAGLMLGRRWAEYLTVFATASLIPFELYELWKDVTPVRTIALVVNIAVLIYLVWRLRHPRGNGA